ncbi:MAG: sulfatase-like hydrolase/transferase, partial [Verrucomicrobia bacterium]|nr:sulfatase-like hydrolase/transferase [Verrucomicrobiota bacterium]
MKFSIRPFAWLVLALLPVLPHRLDGADAARPNILFIITDDQRFDMMGNVTPALHTPEMDRLARDGVRFEHAYVTTSICAASRASMLCGLVERTHRYTFLTPPLGDAFVEMSFPRLLRQAGYRTGYVGKLGVNLRAGTTGRLYDYFHELGPPFWKPQPDGTRRHLTHLEGDAAVAFLEDQARAGGGRPFCLTVGFNAPHAQDEAPQQYFWPPEVDALY